MSLFEALDLVLWVVDKLMRENIASSKDLVFLTPPFTLQTVGLVNVWKRQLFEIDMNE
jgi:hypothetical protein